MYDSLTHRIPHAGVDPIDSPYSAQLLIGELLADPPRFETIALLLDHDRRGMSVMSIDDTVDPDAVLGIAEAIVAASAHTDRLGGVILVSVRPGSGDHIDDLDRWTELDMMFEDGGIELVEWFIVGRGVSCPRALLDEAPRWIG